MNVMMGILALGVAGYAVWQLVTPKGRAHAKEVATRKRERREARAPKAISDVGDRSSGVLACPVCGGTQFKAKRSGKGKMAVGLAARKTRVKCETCGTEYLRG